MGTQKRKRTLKLQENNLFVFFGNRKKQRKNRTTKQKKNKKTPFCMLANIPQFLVNFVFQVTLFCFCKAVFRLKHYKNCVFSRTQRLGITDSKAPFEAPSQRWHFCNQKCHFGSSPVPAEAPIFVVFGDFEWALKRTTFQ